MGKQRVCTNVLASVFTTRIVSRGHHHHHRRRRSVLNIETNLINCLYLRVTRCDRSEYVRGTGSGPTKVGKEENAVVVNTPDTVQPYRRTFCNQNGGHCSRFAVIPFIVSTPVVDWSFGYFDPNHKEVRYKFAVHFFSPHFHVVCTFSVGFSRSSEDWNTGHGMVVVVEHVTQSTKFAKLYMWR